MSTASSASAAQTAGLADVTGRRTTAGRSSDPRRRGRGRWWGRLGRVVVWALLIVLSAIFVYPLVWLVAASLKPRGEVFDNRLIPQTFTPQNYANVWDQLPLLSWALNSIAIAVLAAGFVVISSALVAFGFAYFRFPGAICCSAWCWRP